MVLSLQSLVFAETINLGNKTYENDNHKVILSGSSVEVQNKILKTSTIITPTKVNNTYINKIVYNASVELPNGLVMDDGFLHISTQKDIEGLDDYIRLSYSSYDGPDQVAQTTLSIFDYKKVQAPYANVLWYDDFYNENEGRYNSLNFSRQPEEINGDVVAPLVDMASKTGFTVDFNSETGLINCSNGVDKIVYEIGSPYMKVYGEYGDTVTIKTNVAVYTNDGTPMVSVRKYFETLGFWVAWDKDNRTMDIRGLLCSSIDIDGISGFQNRTSNYKEPKLNSINIPTVDSLDEIYPFRVRVGQFYDFSGNLINEYQFGLMNKDGHVIFEALSSDPIEFWDNTGSIYHYNSDTKVSTGAFIDRKGNYILQGKYNKTIIDFYGNLIVSDKQYRVATFTEDGVKIPRKEYSSGNKLPNGLGQYLVSSGYNAPIYLTNQNGEIVNDNDLITYGDYTPDYNYSKVSSRRERAFNNSLSGIADSYGNVIVPPIFIGGDIKHVYGDIFRIVQDGQIYFIDVSKEDMTDIQDNLVFQTDNVNVYQTLYDNLYGLKLTSNNDEVISETRAHYIDFYDNRFIVMHEYLDDVFDFPTNDNIPTHKKNAAFPWQAHVYESGWYYQLIYDVVDKKFVTPPQHAGAYLGNGFFEYKNLDENYFGIIHLDGHIVVPQSELLNNHRSKVYTDQGNDHGERIVPYPTEFK
jgi:hypothetical protein